MGSVANAVRREPWNKGRIVSQKAPFGLKDSRARRVHFQMAVSAGQLTRPTALRYTRQFTFDRRVS